MEAELSHCSVNDLWAVITLLQGFHSPFHEPPALWVLLSMKVKKTDTPSPQAPREDSGEHLSLALLTA